MMQSLISKRNNQRATETLIKESLLCQLSYTVKEIQLLNSHNPTVFSTSEECSSLIIVLESIFLHGLKKGILKTAFKTVGGAEETKPQPSFWPMVCNYTHKDSISTIRELSQIATDVGRCRVWIRIAMNQTELTSYFKAMEKDRRPINSLYYNYAFLRDRETCDTASKLLDGLVNIQFGIPVNSSILNSWSNEPLMLSGIWSPPMKTPVSKAIDVAEGIEDDEYDDDDALSIKTSSSITTLSTILALDENQALRMILDTPIKKLEKEISAMTVVQPSSQTQQSTSRVEEPILEEEEKEPETAEPEIGNSLSNVPGWNSVTDDVSEELKESKNIRIPEAPKTYTSLLNSFGTPPNPTIDYQKILRKTPSAGNSPDDDDEPSDFELLSGSDSNDFEDKLFKIAREKSLKVQKYQCANCQLLIGLKFAEARLCYLSGEYFCDNCHFNETSVIPSRLIYNWDHKKYNVCSRAARYLSEIAHKPLIDVQKINANIYKAVGEMKELRTIRSQLCTLRAYLHSCRVPVFLALQKKIWPREYLYEQIDVYSLNDLIKVPGGTLAAELNAVVSFAREHVIGCWLCSQKGFICEVCRNPEIIYPFDCPSNYKCRKCSSVYHVKCLISVKSCPKCKRRQQRATSPYDSLPADESD